MKSLFNYFFFFKHLIIIFAIAYASQSNGIDLHLQRDVDFVARSAREIRIANLLRDFSATVRVAGRDC